eukprot:gene34526-33725_t
MGDDLLRLTASGRNVLSSHGGMLAGIADGSIPPTTATQDREECVVVECDADLFELVVNFLRRFDFLGLPYPPDAEKAEKVQRKRRDAEDMKKERDEGGSIWAGPSEGGAPCCRKSGGDQCEESAPGEAGRKREIAALTR